MLPVSGSVSLKKRNGLLVDFRQVQKFDKVHPPLPRFRLRNERLRPRKQFGNFSLGKTSIQSGLLQPLQKQPIFPNVIFGFQWPPQGLRGSFYRSPDQYPKIEYCVI